ncbi:carboxyl-terminal processing protease CtpZ [Synechococcus sp. CBW1107]|uniref:carboxyl-terminal processing protease CtpZ n=1 Tax=unclassified Synechococcus TaxID=2626047 RepID=UPI00308B7FCC|nr:Carboxy-terminal processing protease CtpB [Synechococcus sp. CBW1107]
MSAQRQPPPPNRIPPQSLQRLLRRGLGLTLVLSLLLTPWTTSAALALNDAQQLVVEAWRLVNQSYVDPGRFVPIHWRRLRQKALEQPISSSADAYAAIETMLTPLDDPYTRLLRPAEFSTLQSATQQGTVTGVGLQLGLRAADEQIVVIAPLDGSPAADAHIASGTEVLAVDGIDTAELGLDLTATRLRGPSGSTVLVQLRDPQGQEREVELERRQVDLRPVRSKRLRQGNLTLGYLRITQFSEPVPELVQQAIADLTGKDIEGLILDLRNNSGGLVSAGLAVADDLLNGSVIVETEDRGGIGDRQQAHLGVLYDGPMLTLVNGGTASASEILAGALQDQERSRLVGSRTFGKGLIQTLIPLGDGSGLAVTVARYLTPDGRDIQNQGIRPDLELGAPEPLDPGGEDDSWLEEAQRLLTHQIQQAQAPTQTQ